MLFISVYLVVFMGETLQSATPIGRRFAMLLWTPKKPRSMESRDSWRPLHRLVSDFFRKNVLLFKNVFYCFLLSSSRSWNTTEITCSKLIQRSSFTFLCTPDFFRNAFRPLSSELLFGTDPNALFMTFFSKKTRTRNRKTAKMRNRELTA